MQQKETEIGKMGAETHRQESIKIHTIVLCDHGNKRAKTAVKHS